MPGGTEVQLGVTFPGELLLIEVVRLVRDIVAGQDAETRKKIWAWLLADVERHRKFWGIDEGAELKTLRELLGLEPTEGDG